MIWSVISILPFWEFFFFTPMLADGFSLEFKWQQVSSDLLVSAVIWMDFTRIIIIIIIIISPLVSYSHHVFHWNFNERKPLHVSRTFLSILADLNAVAWIVSIRPLISNFFNPLSKPLGTVPSSQIIIVITIIFMFYNLLGSLARSKYLPRFCPPFFSN